MVIIPLELLHFIDVPCWGHKTQTKDLDEFFFWKIDFWLHIRLLAYGLYGANGALVLI